MPGYQPRHDTDPVWFNGTQVNTLTITSAQAGVRITAIHGWDDRPDIRDVRDLRSGQDGEYADNLYLGGRTITIEGEVYGSTWANLQSRKRTLAATFIPTSDEALLKIPDPSTASPTTSYSTTGMTGYERVSCRVVESIQFGDTLDPCCQVFQVVLRASDPRIYSDVETSTDSGTTGTSSRTVAADQTGTYETPTTITVNGPTAADVVVSNDDGLSLSLDGLALTSSESVTFNTLNRTADVSSSFSGIRTRKSSLVAGYMLNETSGTTADNYQGTAALDMTYTGGFTLNQTGPGTGLVSVDLNGSTGYVIGTAQAAFAVTSFSIEMWLNPDSVTAGTRYIASSYDGAAARWTLQLTSSRVALSVGNVTSPAVSHCANGAFVASTWNHVVATYDNTTCTARVYINGALSVGPTQTVGVGGHTVGATEKLAIGANAGSPPGASFDGKVGPCAFYNAALSAADVADLYEAATASTGLTENGYTYLNAAATNWAQLGTDATTFTLASSGLNTGSKLNVTHRPARL